MIKNILLLAVAITGAAFVQFLTEKNTIVWLAVDIVKAAVQACVVDKYNFTAIAVDREACRWRWFTPTMPTRTPLPLPKTKAFTSD